MALEDSLHPFKELYRISPAWFKWSKGRVYAALPRSIQHWSLTTLREKLIKMGAKVVIHSRYVIFQMAEVTVLHELFAAILKRLQRFDVPPPFVPRG